MGAPGSLREFEKQIDDVAGVVRWVRIDEATLRQRLRTGPQPTADERRKWLMDAVQYDEIDVLKVLADADIDRSMTADMTSALMLVRSAAAVRVLIAAGADARAKGPFGGAIGTGASKLPEVTEALLEAGAPPNGTSDDSASPLVSAACWGNIAVVQLLLAAGADPARRGSFGTALDCARQAKQQSASNRRFPDEESPAFVVDFDAVISAIERAMVNRKQP